MTKTPRAVVVGPGYIGEVHADALRRNGVVVAGFVGSGSEAGRARARDMGIPSFASLAEALDSGPVDCVHIATPNHLHAPLALEAISAGKHVVCEKPLAMNPEEGRALLHAATVAGIVHAVNFNFRFYTLVRQMRALVRTDALGPLYLIHGGYLQDWLLFASDWNWRLDPTLGGNLRAIADIGSHWLDLAGYVTGQQPRALVADLATFVPERQRPLRPVQTFAGKELAPDEYDVIRMNTDDYASVLIDFDHGARGTLTVSQVSAGRKNRLSLEVSGAASSAAWTSERVEELWIGHRNRANELLLRDPPALLPDARAVTTAPGGHAEGYIETHRALFRAVYAAIAAGWPPDEPDYPTFGDGLRSLVLGESIARSARERRWIEPDLAKDQ
ncbi:MAG: Gfo/Idh/MocA family oxidoreductase [Thermomicrobiales bacterium]